MAINAKIESEQLLELQFGDRTDEVVQATQALIQAWDAAGIKAKDGRSYNPSHNKLGMYCFTGRLTTGRVLTSPKCPKAIVAAAYELKNVIDGNEAEEIDLADADVLEAVRAEVSEMKARDVSLLMRCVNSITHDIKLNPRVAKIFSGGWGSFRGGDAAGDLFGDSEE